MSTAVAGTPAASRSSATAWNCADTGATSAAKAFDLEVRAGRLASRDDTLRVTRGDRVELRWTADAPIVLHLHGYDIEASVAPGAPSIMSFQATIPGRFPISQHAGDGRQHRSLAYLEVRP